GRDREERRRARVVVDKERVRSGRGQGDGGVARGDRKHQAVAGVDPLARDRQGDADRLRLRTEADQADTFVAEFVARTVRHQLNQADVELSKTVSFRVGRGDVNGE